MTFRSKAKLIVQPCASLKQGTRKDGSPPQKVSSISLIYDRHLEHPESGRSVDKQQCILSRRDIPASVHFGYCEGTGNHMDASVVPSLTRWLYFQGRSILFVILWKYRHSKDGNTAGPFSASLVTGSGVMVHHVSPRGGELLPLPCFHQSLFGMLGPGLYLTRGMIPGEGVMRALCR